MQLQISVSPLNADFQHSKATPKRRRVLEALGDKNSSKGRGKHTQLPSPAQVELINDFVAQGYGMLTLADDEAGVFCW